MQFVNKVISINTMNKTFVFRIPGRNKSLFFFFITIMSSRLRIIIKIWKVKLTIEIG